MSRRIPILTFHSLDDQQSVISFSPQLFRQGITKLHRQGYTAISLLEAADLIRRGARWPERSFVITFDDGYENFYTEALPLLQDLQMTATVFVTVGDAPQDERLPSLEGRSMLSWRELREIHERGIDIGAHTVTHADLTRLSIEKIKAEICDSKKLIEDRLGDQVKCFAYPFGRYDGRSRRVAAENFDCACSDRLGLATRRSDLYALERVDAYYLRTEEMFDLMLSKSFPAYILSRSIPRRIRRMLRPIL